MSEIIEDYIMNLKVADKQLEQIINLRQEVDRDYQIELPFTFILDKNYRFLYTNIAYRLLWGMEPESLISKNSLQLGFDTEQFTHIKTILDSVFDKGKTLKFIKYIDLPNRGKRAFETVVTPLYNNLNEIEAVISTAMDITERLIIEEEKGKQKQLYENLVENSPDIIARHDRNHRYLFVNSALERITGIAPSELIGKTFDNIGFPEEIWRLWSDRCEEVFETGKIVTFDTEFLSPKGVIKLETILIPERDKKYNIETILAICRLGPRQLKHAMTELEQAIKKLRKEKQDFATIIDNIPMIISRFDKDLRHIYVSPASETLCGVKAELCLGKTWHEMGMAETVYLPFQKFYEEVFSTGLTAEFETKFPNALGEMAYFQTLVIPEMDDLGQVQTVLSISQDITEKKRAEAEMSRLDRLNLIGEMAASIGHEVRNPLTTVRGYLQYFQKKKDTIEYREQFKIMIDELDRSNLIISEFLSLAKNKAVEFKLYNLNTIISTLFLLIQADGFRFGHNVQIEMGNVPDINLDEKEVRQLLLNLTRNAFEAMKFGGVLTIQSYVDGSNVMLAVSDTGGGIPPRILDKIGTPFLTTKEDGVGLGLAVCYRIAHRHGAKIDVKTSSQGTIFLIAFQI
ncbi:PAS domain-containing protein [Pelosinus sp. sgz500959]|uniref:PAS domain-containing protein n=1 Tax=Pelosinus sp. sgz500959 TaxID=3242472 RepID=UPI0036702252